MMFQFDIPSTTASPRERGAAFVLLISWARSNPMPREETVERARQDAKEGKAPSTQAGEFVREEIEHVREGKHGARLSKQAIAIGLSKDRRAGVKLPPPKSSNTSTPTCKKARQDTAAAKQSHKPAKRRSRATSKALKRENRQSTSSAALSRQSRQAASRRSRKSRSAAAKKAARTRKRRRQS
jgi:hypothetical protein